MLRRAAGAITRSVQARFMTPFHSASASGISNISNINSNMNTNIDSITNMNINSNFDSNININTNPNWTVSSTHSTFTGPQPKSPNDNRLYRLIRLPNALQCLLISDAAADKAAISATCAVGSMSDTLPGIAHAIEHCSFLGTSKYPAENEYSAYLSANGGSSNAYTAEEKTSYFLDVMPGALEGAVDRFAQFFISPLFAAGGIERECTAVNSEHAKNLQNDDWRAYQLSKHLSSPSHPFNSFGTGDLDTLYNHPIVAGKDPRAEFVQWHEDNYSADRTAVAIVGTQSLDDLQSMVIEHFSPVVNKKLPVKNFSPDVWKDEQKATLVFQQTVMDIRMLTVEFVLPELRQHFRSMPVSMLSHLAGHEGPGSLAAYLRAQGLVNSVAAVGEDIARGFGKFSVVFDLTERGIEEHRAVACAMFSYLDLIRSSLDRERTFDEIARLSKLAFTYAEKSADSASFVSKMSALLVEDTIPPAALLDSNVVSEWDPVLFDSVLNSLTPAACRITISAQSPPSQITPPDMIEPVYRSKYSCVKIPADFLAELENPPKIEQLAVPLPNLYIPESLDIVAKEKSPKPATSPTLLHADSQSELYHKTDDRWLVPRASVKVRFCNPAARESVEGAVKSALVVELLKDKLAVEVYDAELAGLQYSMSAAGDFITLELSGYNDKLPVLLNTIISVSKTIKFQQDRFDLMVDRFKRSWANSNFSPPYNLIMGFHSEIVMQKQFEQNKDQKLLALASITVQQVQDHLLNLFKQSHIKILTHGNMDEAASKSILTTLKNEYQFGENPSLVTSRGQYPAQNTNVIVQRQSENAGETNSCIFWTSFVCLYGEKETRYKNDLYARLIKEPCFNILRTQEQLGYVVFSMAQTPGGTVWIGFLIQSERTAAYLNGRIEKFIETYRGILAEMAEDEFQKTKNSLIAEKLEEPKNMADENERYWSPIFRGYNDFHDRQEQAKALESMTKADMLDFHDKYIKASNEMKKVVLHWNSIAETSEKDIQEPIQSPSTIKYKSEEFDKFLALLEAAPPIKAIL